MARARLSDRRRRPASRAAIAAGAFGAFWAMTTAPSTTRAQGVAGAGLEVGAVVHAPAAAPVDASRLRAALGRAAARAGSRLEVRPLARAAARATRSVDAARLEVFPRVERLVAQGWRGYLEARFGDAADLLDRARAEAAGLLDLDGGLELYAELSLRRGAVQLSLGRDRDADDDLRLAARLDPGRAVSDVEFKPAVVERYRAATAAARARVRRRVVTRPPGATLEVDGRTAGAAPLDLELEEGIHVLVARAPGRTARAVRIEIAAGQSGAIDLQLDADRDPRAAALGDGAARLRPGASVDRASDVIAAMVDLGELDGFLLVAPVWRMGQPALLGQYCAGSPLLCGPLVEVAQPAAADLDRAADVLWRQTAAAAPPSSGEGPTLVADGRLVRGESAPGPARAPAGGSGPWWKSRWIWVGVGGAALSAAAAGFLIGVAGDQDASWSPSIDPCEFGGC